MGEWLRNCLFPSEKQKVNTVYFAGLFVLLLAMSLYQIYYWRIPFSGSSFLFFAHAVGQPFVEAGFFMIVTRVLNRYAWQWVVSLFVGIAFVMVTMQFISFVLLRAMDVRIPHFMKYIFGSGVQHFLHETQSAQNGNMLFPIITIMLLSCLFGFVLYRTTSRFSSGYLPLSQLCYSVYGVVLALTAIDCFIAPSTDFLTYQKYKKVLPIGSIFISPHPTIIRLQKPFAKFRDEAQTVQALEKKNIAIEKRPNIFVFVIESLRNDFVTEKTAPTLYAFGQNNVSFGQSHANANCTHPSWHAIFHADVPFHWTKMQHSWEGGSIPLRMLKQAGYKINVFASSNIQTFHMDKLIFGHDHQLIDFLHECQGSRSAAECDAHAMDRMMQRIEPEGNLNLIFLDSTHSKYSVPDDFAVKFEPTVTDFNYLDLSPEMLEMIKNRYRNSISYVDTLFASFFQNLKERGLYEDAIIAVTADHGEEFFEDGAMFHGMHLNEYQTSVPLYYKFQKNRWEPKTNFTTHMDIFPSILHYLSARSDFAELFDGQSIFASGRWPYRIVVMQNGSFHPKEFKISNELESYYFRFPETRDISGSLELEALTTPPASGRLSHILGPLLK